MRHMSSCKGISIQQGPLANRVLTGCATYPTNQNKTKVLPPKSSSLRNKKGLDVPMRADLVHAACHLAVVADMKGIIQGQVRKLSKAKRK